jgi:transcriptional antiterminator RfaH
MTSFKSGWYLLYTMPRHEKKVAEQLAGQQLTYYLPMLNTVSNRSGRIKPMQVPMFPSYVFIYLQDLKGYFAGLNMNGVLSYVKFGGRIAHVADSIISNLKLVSEHGQNVEISFSEFQQGMLLIFSEGPFAGMQCEMVQYKDEEKILVRLYLLQRNVLMEVPAIQLINLPVAKIA